MSDTANPANLASADEFDARLKASDEVRWLATRYAPLGPRERLVGLYLLNIELQRALQAREPMLGKIRIQWWRETLEQMTGKGPVRRHDLALELARLTIGRPDLHDALNKLVDGYDDILDDHLHAGGHSSSNDHEARHLAVAASLVQVAGRMIDKAITAPSLAALGEIAEANIALAAGLPGAAARWSAARVLAGDLPAPLWPAILHLAAPVSVKPSPFGLRRRIFIAMLFRRLGPSPDVE